MPDSNPERYEEPSSAANDIEPAEPPLPPPPERLGTPESSVAAAPKWFLERRVYGAGKQPSYAPQGEHDLRARLYERADVTGKRPRTEQTLLVCRFEVGDYHDSHAVQRFVPGASSKADLVAFAKLGERAMFAPGPSESSHMYLTLPLLGLAQGDQLRVAVADRDFMSFDHVETVEGAYTGELPWKIAGKRVRAECRGVSRTVVESMLPGVVATARKQLRSYAKCQPDPHDSSLGRRCLEGTGSHSLHDALSGPVSLVGWDDPRVRPLVQRASVISDEFEATLQKLVREQLGGQRRGTFADDRLQVQSIQHRCESKSLKRAGVKRDQCGLRLKVKNIGPVPLFFENDELGPLDDIGLVSGDGKRHATEVLAYRAGNGWRALEQKRRLKPGQAVELLLTTPRDAPAPLLLRGERKDSVRALDGQWIELADTLALKPLAIRCGTDVVKRLRFPTPISRRKQLEASRCVLRVLAKNLGKEPRAFSGSEFGPIDRMWLIRRDGSKQNGADELPLLAIVRDRNGELEELDWAGHDDDSELPPQTLQTIVFLIDHKGLHTSPPQLDELALRVQLDDARWDYLRVDAE